MSLSADNFRLVWTNASDKDDYSAKTFEVIGHREAIWYLWYVLYYKSTLPTEPKIYSLDGRVQDPRKGLDGLQGLNEYLAFKQKDQKIVERM